MFDDWDDIGSFRQCGSKARLKYVYSRIMTEYRNVCSYLRKEARRMSFLKCDDPSCCDPPTRKTWQFLRGHGLLTPEPSETIPVSYQTCLEMKTCKAIVPKFETLSSAKFCPSLAAQEHLMCQSCQKWCFIPRHPWTATLSFTTMSARSEHIRRNPITPALLKTVVFIPQCAISCKTTKH